MSNAVDSSGVDVGCPQNLLITYYIHYITIFGGTTIHSGAISGYCFGYQGFSLGAGKVTISASYQMDEFAKKHVEISNVSIIGLV